MTGLNFFKKKKKKNDQLTEIASLNKEKNLRDRFRKDKEKPEQNNQKIKEREGETE